MEKTVRQRTSLYPANESEEAIDAVLRSLRTDVRAAKDLALSGVQRRGELAELAERIRSAAGSLVDRWPRLERLSPYRLASLNEAISIISELADLNETPGGQVGPLSFDDSLAGLFSLRARALLSERLRMARGSRSIRSTASELNVALGYLSDLESGRANPPSEAILKKLADGLAIDLSDVAATIARAKTLKDAHRQRTARTRRRHASPVAHALGGPWLSSLAALVAEDPELMELIDAIQRLPVGLRRALRNLLAELEVAHGGQMPHRGSLNRQDRIG
jgi:transcriptional regulator with XRE-family HTH domain